MISVDPLTWRIFVPQTYLTYVGGTLYNLDTDQFRKDLKAIEANQQGAPWLKTHLHNTEVTIVGTTFARAIGILPPYSVEFENGSYSVLLLGSNNNIWDIQSGILVQNNVQVIPTNSAGLTTPVTSDDVWLHPQASSVTVLNSRNANL